jgi:hypothetical protein
VTIYDVAASIRDLYAAATASSLASAYCFVGDWPTSVAAETDGHVIRVVPLTTRLKSLNIGTSGVWADFTIQVEVTLRAERTPAAAETTFFQTLEDCLQVLTDNYFIASGTEEAQYESLEYSEGYAAQGEQSQRQIIMRVVYSGAHLTPTA